MTRLSTSRHAYIVSRQNSCGIVCSVSLTCRVILPVASRHVWIEHGGAVRETDPIIRWTLSLTVIFFRSGKKIGIFELSLSLSLEYLVNSKRAFLRMPSNLARGRVIYSRWIIRYGRFRLSIDGLLLFMGRKCVCVCVCFDDAFFVLSFLLFCVCSNDVVTCFVEKNKIKQQSSGVQTEAVLRSIRYDSQPHIVEYSTVVVRKGSCCRPCSFLLL